MVDIFVAAEVPAGPVEVLYQLQPPLIVCTGLHALVPALFPRAPLAPEPQSHKLPSVFIAEFVRLQALILLQLVPPLIVCTGLENLLGLPKVLFPSTPALLNPHNHRLPSVLIAAEWLDPILTLRQFVPPVTV